MNEECRVLITNLKTDCWYYRGDRPCAPHTREGKQCQCDEYQPITRRGVIIKLGAAGDVLRTTPLLRALRPAESGCHVLWVTHSPELLPSDACEAVRPTAATLARLQTGNWDFCWNLDKDVDACVLAAVTPARERKGFTLKAGVPVPVDESAWHKFATGIDDGYSKSNRMSYVEEIFQIVGLPFEGQEYWLKSPSPSARNRAAELLPGDGWVGLNTGAGHRWPTRLWPESSWLKAASDLRSFGFKPVLLGGPEEVELNVRLAQQTGCPWLGVQPLDVFHAMIERCGCIVTSVTQAMHLAIATKVPLVLMNNIFNPHEFELYGRGEILGPPKPCDCFYQPTCRTGRNCMSEISPQAVVEAVRRVTKPKPFRQSRSEAETAPRQSTELNRITSK
jgi:ADP-heptose:LPS heptosyltransferase